LEGRSFPFFGFAYSIDKIQYNIDLNLDDKIDHGRAAVLEAQRLANFFVDEARLSGSQFRKTRDEANALIQNYDYFLTAVDISAPGSSELTFESELYLFE
jgi:hypothetical protein